ncbi:unnamed protein product [Leptidea sinapis]|uniref:DUF3668 domain-containing protein n=1 Tax=Leptidea sinapis TaxID=189913 RepID=A0A5E4QM11_9NEOP|nr:unnamed protein product [Leptidea sinapis]
MDELRGPTIQIVLHVKEGLGFGFLRCPFIVSGSLNGYMLETDPAVPTHAPIFDAELVWEADKRRFRSLRVQNVPVKVEVYTTSTQGQKDKVGYLLLSLLGAQPCPANKFVDLLMSLTIEDRLSTPTPRNELRMFHSNESAYPSARTYRDQPDGKSMMLKLEEYISESKKVPSSAHLQPKLLCDEGLIQIGDGNHLFVLSLVIGSVENLDVIVPQQITESTFCHVNYSIFTHNITTDRVSVPAGGRSAHFNQRTSLRLRCDLAALAAYFHECCHLVAALCVRDLRFVAGFGDADRALVVHERCFVVGEPGPAAGAARRAYVDKPQLTARSATQLKVPDEKVEISARKEDMLSSARAGSCTELRASESTAYSNIHKRIGRFSVANQRDNRATEENVRLSHIQPGEAG